MNQFRALLLFCFFFCCSIGRASEPISWLIQSDGLVEYDPATGIASGTNGVTISYSNAVLTAQSVIGDQVSGQVVADGNVTIRSQNVIWKGDSVTYNFKTDRIETGNFRSGHIPFFIGGEELKGNPSNKIYSARNAIVTTDDLAEPAYKIRARKIRIVPDQYFEVYDATIRIGDVPVFYFPYFHRAIGRRANHFDFTPGYRSAYGPFLLTTYNWYAKTNLEGKIHLDSRQLRGVGVGPELDYNLGALGQGTAEYYYLHDEDPNRNSPTNDIPADRHRIALKHQATYQTNLNFKLVGDYQSDPLIEHDFFETEYRRNVQPKSFFEANRIWPNFTLDVLAQPQVNDFQETVERLPDVRIEALRQQLGNTPLYYEGENTGGFYNRRFVDNSTNFSAARFDTFHQIVLPHTFFGWLNFIPRVGGRFTYYSEADGRGATTDEEKRTVFNTGAEISFKSSRLWEGARSKLLQVNGLRHIIEPSINYAYVPRPNVLPTDLPQFDPELASLRTLPIEYPAFNSIDSIDSQNVLRFGVRNLFQTKRDDAIETLLSWNLSTDWRLNPRTNYAGNGRQTTFASLNSSMEFRPREWITFQSETRYDLNNRSWLEANHRLVLEPNNVWSLSLGHRYLDDEPNLGPGHNLITTSLYYRMNENWAARISHHYEARDGTLQEQYYSIYRDLRSWTTALTFRVRDNRDRSDDFTVAITFSLKAFPRFGLNADRDRPTELVGY